MAEYIEREALLNAINDMYFSGEADEYGVMYAVICCIENMPAENVVPAVESKDCIGEKRCTK